MTEDQHIARLVELYRQGFQDIVAAIITKDAKGKWTGYSKAVLRDVLAILQRLDTEAEAWASDAIKQVYKENQAAASALLRELGAAATGSQFAQLHQGAIDVLVQNLTGSLKSASQFVGRRVNDVFRRAGVEAAALKWSKAETLKEAKQNVVDKLLSQGLNGFRDKIGRKWDLVSYAEMAARTTTREAASVATINQCVATGHDLVQITVHSPTCHICAPLQGRVYSLTGTTKGYPLLSQGRRPPLHPNCRHVLTVYSPQFDDHAGKTKQRSNEPFDVDPRSDREKAVYNGLRAQKTLATTRRKAREVLAGKEASTAEKVKAAGRLEKTYTLNGKTPTGKDAQIINQFHDYIHGNRIEGLIVGDNVHIPEGKVLRYALNKEHSKGGRDKAVAFERALGYHQGNYQELIENVTANVGRFPATFKKSTSFGDHYEVLMELEGPNGKKARVLTAWLMGKDRVEARLLSLYVTKRKPK